MNQDQKKFLTVVIPVYNEGTQIFSFVDSVSNALSSLPIEYGFLIVDDGSTDKTWNCILELTGRKNNVSGIRFSRNFGKEAAISAGLDKAGGDAILVIDGDFQHPIALIERMVDRWLNGKFEIVEGVKGNRGRESVANRMFAKAFYYVFSKSTRLDMRNATDFKLLDRKVVDAWKRLPENIVFFRGMSSWLGFRKTSIEFTVQPRRGGRTKWGNIALLQLAINAITSFSALPLYAVVVVGGIFLVFTILLGFQTLFTFFSGKAVAGFTTVILLQLIIGVVNLFGLGILGLYIARIFQEVKERPRYLIADFVEPKADNNFMGTIS